MPGCSPCPGPALPRPPAGGRPSSVYIPTPLDIRTSRPLSRRPCRTAGREHTDAGPAADRGGRLACQCSVMSLDQGASAFMEQAASPVQCSPVGSRRLFSLSRRYSTGDLRALAPSRPRYALGADWMLSVRLLATNGYEFLPRDGAGYDGGQRSTRCNREIGGKCSRLRCAIALRVPVAELVGGLVGMPREAPQGAEESFGVLTADTRESRDVCLSTERVEVVWQLFACRKRQTTVTCSSRTGSAV